MRMMSAGQVARDSDTCRWLGRAAWRVLAGLLLLGNAANSEGDIAPYGVDPATLHLWHLDDGAVPCVNIVPGGANLTSLSGGATLGNASFPGFGSALGTVDGGQSGTTSSAKDAVLAALPLVDGTADNVQISVANPISGAFTFEAIVRVDFNPALNMALNGRNSGMQIISGEGDASAERLFQWRLAPVGYGSGDTSVCRLEFINLRQGVAIQTVAAPIPASGPDAIVSNNWYHVAVTYDGNENTPDNLKFYWTLLHTNRSVANVIGTASLANDLSTGVACDFAVGNEGRATGGASDNFIGLIDEVRISSEARAPNEFVFRSVSVLEASGWQSPNIPQNTLDGDLNTRWSAQGDGQWITFDLGRVELVQRVDIAFYLGNSRTSRFDVLISSDHASWWMVATNAASSGATLGLEPFSLPGGSFARYVRILGHGNSQNDWNSFTEVAIVSSPAGDSDADGLPDAWEMNHFGNLDQTAGGDPDGDGFANHQEFQAGSNPNNALSVPGDVDGDELTDSWEQVYFGTLAYGPSDDFDNDGFTNAQEFAAGTNPTNALSNPQDTDADGLPDWWEQLYLGTLTYGPLDDPDNDGSSNLQEYQAASDPSNPASVPTETLVRYNPVDDGNPATSEFGYAGASSINAVAFIKSALMTVSNQQFIAYYGRHQTNSTYAFNNRIWIGRRNIASNVWEVFRTDFQPNNITDGHDVVSFGIDGDGYMHLSWGMHGNPFHYSRSTNPVTGHLPIGFGPDSTMTGQEGNVTYPQFLSLPNGDLLYLFREGSSGDGDVYLNRYNRATQAWTDVHRRGSTHVPFIKGTGWIPNYNAYPNMPCVDAAGNVVLTWTWRYNSDSPAGETGYQTNHDFDYARSTNGGVTWLRQNGAPYALPINERGENGNTNSIAEKVVSIPEGYSLINQAGMCLDDQNKPVIASWWAPGTATNDFRRQYMVAFPGTNQMWEVRQVSHRTRDPVGTRYSESAVRDLGRPVVVCDVEGRIIVLYRDNEGSNGLTVVHSLPRAIDPNRNVWTTFDLTTDNLGVYEPVIDLERWQRDNVLHVLYQPASGLGYTPPSNTAAEIGILEWNAAAYFAHRPAMRMAVLNGGGSVALSFASRKGWAYHVQTSTNLSTWATVATLAGTGGEVQYVHTNTPAAPERYWRVRAREGGFSQ